MKEKQLFMKGIFGFILLLVIMNFASANIVCYSNSDCVSGFFGSEYCSNNDIFKNFVNSSCINPGTDDSYCSDNSIPTMLFDCGVDSWENYGSNYCIGNDLYHSRTGTLRGCRVINVLSNISGCFSEFLFQESIIQNCPNGCSNGACNNPPIACYSDSQCGSNGFFGELSCQNNNVFQNFNTYRCNNPGTVSSSCSNSVNLQLKEGCGINSCDNYGANYCNGNNIYHSRTCYNRGCSSGACFSTSYNDEAIVQNCISGCSNGLCLNVICSNDIQCGSNGFSTNKYCKGDDVYSDYLEYKCNNPGTLNSSCSINISSKIFDKCDYRCKNEECYDKSKVISPVHEINDSSDSEKDYFIYTSDSNILASYSNESNETIHKIELIKSDKVNRNIIDEIFGNNLLLIFIILIILLIIFIIILTLIR